LGVVGARWFAGALVDCPVHGRRTPGVKRGVIFFFFFFFCRILIPKKKKKQKIYGIHHNTIRIKEFYPW